MQTPTRREVLAQAAGATTLGALGTLACAQEQPRPVGWAILGLGGYAQGQIMPAFRDCKVSKLVAVISGTPDKAKRLANQYGLPEEKIFSYQNLEKIAEHPDIEVVYVITPPGTHKEFTLRSARAGKHVCCEKPMANTSQECQEMIAECKRLGKLLQIGYRSHFENHNLRAIQACQSGELGTLRSVFSDHGFNMPGGTWRTQKALSGGGGLWDIGIYSVQAVRYLTGAEPTEVMGFEARLPEDRFKEVDDVAQFVLQFPKGIVASCGSGYSWAGMNRYTVIGTRAVLHAEPATGYGGHRLTIRNRPVEVERNNQFAAQMDHLSECIRTGIPLRTPGEMGLQDIKIMEAVLRSAREKRSVRLA